MKDIDLMDLLIHSIIDKATAFGLLSSKKIIIDSTHTLSVFKRYTPSEAISRRSHDLLANVKESGIYRELFTKLPMIPVSKESNMMVEYAQSLLTNITKMGIAITTGI